VLSFLVEIFRKKQNNNATILFRVCYHKYIFWGSLIWFLVVLVSAKIVADEKKKRNYHSNLDLSFSLFLCKQSFIAASDWFSSSEAANTFCTESNL